MTDKVQKIKAIIQQYANKGEILLEESYAKGEHASTTGYWDGYTDCAKLLLKGIDSLQEEPVSIDFEQELYKAFGQVKDFTLGMRIAKWFYDMGKDSKELVSKFLNTESMIESYKQRLVSQANGMKNSPFIDMCLASYKHGINETLDTLNLSNVERTVKDWKEMPVSEDLEKEMDNYLPTVFSKDMDSGEPRFTTWFRALRKTARHFTEWKKQQMMKDAVEATVHIDAGGYPYIPQIELYDYDKDIPLAKEGDKYKVVLIKEE